jgi:uncharacterized membrane protein
LDPLVLVILALIAGLALFVTAQRAISRRVRRLEAKIAQIEGSLRILQQQSARRPLTEAEGSVAEAQRPEQTGSTPAPMPPPGSKPAPALSLTAPELVSVGPESPVEPPRGPSSRSFAGGGTSAAGDRSATAPTTPDALHGWAARLKLWLVGGNAVARVGIIVLFFGVAFLLRYAAEQGLFPIELRLGATALGGLVLLAVGWLQGTGHRGYGLVLQGGGVGIVYLTVFAAVDLYDLLPALPGLALMALLVAGAGVLAVLQDARSLAVLAMVGGFLAPILISSGGNHVQLFAYYAVLDAGVLAIAWFRAWRALNLVGFVFTFVILGAWGYRFYQPDHFPTTEPFLALFFLFYVAVPVLFALRQPPRLKGYVDGPLVFGVPLVAFGLQSPLVSDFEYGLAWSAVAAALFYALLAAALRRAGRESLRLLAEAFLALAVAFGTLAVPLAVDGHWTASAWALEGAALVWVGVRQHRLSAHAFGLLLQLAAGVSLLASSGQASGSTPLLNTLYLGALMLSIAGVFSAYQLHRHREDLYTGEAALSVPALAWGLAWWYGGGLNEIWRHGPEAHRDSVLLGLVIATSVLLSLLSRRLRWQDAARPALLLLPVMAAIAIVQYSRQLLPHPLADWGWATWGAAFAAHYWLLWRHRDEWSGELPGDLWHAAGLWLIVFLAVWEAWWLVGNAVPDYPVWRYLVVGTVPALVVFALPYLARRLEWPLQTFRRAYFDLGVPPLVAFTGLWLLHASLQRGDPGLLRYLPIANPLEIAQCLALAIVVRSVLRDWDRPALRKRWQALILLAFVILNGMIARATHFLGAVPFEPVALWASPLFQTTASVTWTLVALALMVGGTRLATRALWIAGSTLLAAVVAKLFIVDLAGIGTVARIVSFIVVGLLILVIGYLSPLPPRSRPQQSV